jgi:flagellar motor switch protein FliN/FliY
MGVSPKDAIASAVVSAPTQTMAIAAGGSGTAGGNSAAGLTARTMEAHPAWPMISRLPTTLAVSIPLSGFRVCDLLALRSGQTVASVWAATEDVPLRVGQLQICWGEFEVVEQQMALRLTRLA